MQITPRVATAASTCSDGSWFGSCAIPKGAYTRAVSATDAATTPTEGSDDKRRAMIIGPIA